MVLVVVGAEGVPVVVPEVVVVELLNPVLEAMLDNLSDSLGTEATVPYHFLYQLSQPALFVTSACSRLATTAFCGEVRPVMVEAWGMHCDTRLSSSGPRLRAKDSRALVTLNHCDETAGAGVTVARISQTSQALTMVLVASPEMTALLNHSATFWSAVG